MPYLILHKVRGQPAFDVAEPIQIGSEHERGWIIPTSGHRAYPYRHWDLKSLEYALPGGLEVLLFPPWYYIPDDWPDHYPNVKQPPTAPREYNSLEELGL